MPAKFLPQSYGNDFAATLWQQVCRKVMPISFTPTLLP
jgi:hypothetical protein